MSHREFRAKYDDAFWQRTENASTSDTLYIDTRWVVLYKTDAEKIPIARVKDALKSLNMMYGGTNTQDIDKIPSTARAPWRARLGNPNIQFLPLDSSKLNVTYQKVSSYLDNSAPVNDAASRVAPIDGVLNIYIGASSSGNILGQSEIYGSTVYLLYSTVGGFTVPGALSNYNQGKTLTHEVGHSFGLLHTFTDETCNHVYDFLDVPESVNPNFNAEIAQVGGVWIQRGDNRENDRLYGTSTSCLSIQDDPSTATDEMACNYMDYASDAHSLMFSAQQSLFMREYLQSSDNTSLQLKSATDRSISEGDGNEIMNESTTESGLNITLIVCLSVAGAILLIIFIWFMVRYAKNKKEAERFKKLAAYNVPVMLI